MEKYIIISKTKLQERKADLKHLTYVYTGGESDF